MLVWGSLSCWLLLPLIIIPNIYIWAGGGGVGKYFEFLPLPLHTCRQCTGTVATCANPQAPPPPAAHTTFCNSFAIVAMETLVGRMRDSPFPQLMRPRARQGRASLQINAKLLFFFPLSTAASAGAAAATTKSTTTATCLLAKVASHNTQLLSFAKREPVVSGLVSRGLPVNWSGGGGGGAQTMAAAAGGAIESVWLFWPASYTRSISLDLIAAAAVGRSVGRPAVHGFGSVVARPPRCSSGPLASIWNFVRGLRGRSLELVHSD